MHPPLAEALLEAAPALVVVDEGGRIQLVNAQAEALFGYRRDELIGSPVERLLPDRVREAHVAHRSAYRADPVQRPMGAVLDLVARRRDGTEVPVDVSLSPLRTDRGLMVLAAVRDVTERRLREQQLRLLQLAVEHSSDAVVITDADLDRGLRVVYVNPAFTRATGYAPEEVVGRSPRSVQAPWTDPADRARLRRTFERGEAFRGENVNRRKDGSTYEVELHIAPVRNAAGEVTHYVSVQRDITERKAAERQLTRLALHDPLTGLPNRTLFGDRLDLAVAGARRDGSALALLLADLDGFKEVNDALGHAAGDELLRQVGPRLRAALREIDTVARIGGDEFAVVLPGATAPDAGRVAAKLLAALDAPFTAAGQPVAVGASFGIAVYPDNGDTGDVLLRHADAALYAAKGSGAGWAFYAPDADADVAAHLALALAADLRSAVRDGGLALHYQPVVSVPTGTVTRAEALVRWPHPERGLLLPAEFMGLAERGGLMRPLTDWVLRTALGQQAAWRAGGLDLPVAVNVSMRGLIDPELPQSIERILAASAPGARLAVEITEGVAMAHPERTIAVLARLRALGVGAEIDDFGTGYSSLAYLQRLPVDAVKIDRSLIGRIATDPGSLAIVRSTIELCHSLGLRAVAEGVEDRETWERLAELGCDEAQGYHISRPLGGAELERWVTVRGARVTATTEGPRAAG